MPLHRDSADVVQGAPGSGTSGNRAEIMTGTGVADAFENLAESQTSLPSLLDAPPPFDQDVVGALSADDAVKLNQIKTKTAGILNLGNSSFNNVPTDDQKNNQKERILDSIWTLMAKRTIRHITYSTVNWINSGFQGGPAFVTDFGGFLSDVADEEIGRFIEGSTLSFLCDPFQTDIRIALALPAPFERRISCTLSDVIDNIDGFISGDFSQGGWAGWFELTTVPQNNPYGAYLLSASELEMRIASRQNIETTKLGWGRGFMSWEECEELPADFVGPPRCEILTPGAVIENQLEHVLGSGVRQLELADEFNEIVNALISQLMVQVFTGTDGLRGTSRSFDGRSSYISRLATTEDTTVIQNIIAGSEIEFSRVITEELVYLTSKQGTLKSFTDSEALLLNLVACYDSKLANNALNLTIAQKATALERRNSSSSIIDTLITPRKNILLSEINIESALIIKLDSLLTNIQNSTNPVQLQVPTSELESMRRQDLLKGSGIFAAEQERAIISSEMSALDATTQSQISECQAFPPPPQQTPGQ